MRARMVLVATLLTGTTGAAWVGLQQADEFVHLDHVGLFPLCEGCHEGVATGVDADRFPTRMDCTSCHDGVTEDEVDWIEATPRATNLAYDHVGHAAQALTEGDTTTCADCHQDPDQELGPDQVEPERMAVITARPEGCLNCHAHEAPDHLQPERECATCHVPLTEATRLDVVRIEAFPEPTSHEDPDFVLTHREGVEVTGADCATCHAQESCARCHANAMDVPSIESLQPDERIAALVADIPPEYPEPGAHEEGGWRWEHGPEAAGAPGDCANCHTQPSCLECHRAATWPSVALLPEGGGEAPLGVVLADEADRVHAAGIETRHEIEAAANEQSCLGCHEQPECVDCHRGATSDAFHLPNFMQTHGPEAYRSETDCAACHNPEVFCRACHQGVGLASGGALDVAFHSARPFWLLGHGGAARQNLEGCATCHAQSDCARCHSAVGGWRVNPHGPGFDASRARSSNPGSCIVCHITGIGRE